jgi:hypothetical protein
MAGPVELTVDVVARRVRHDRRVRTQQRRCPHRRATRRCFGRRPSMPLAGSPLLLLGRPGS